MKQFISIKTVLAKPMTLHEYGTYRHGTTPADTDVDQEGYLVEYLNSPSDAHPNHKNYISWSPKEQFETTHHEVGEKAKTVETALRGQLSTIMAEFKAKEEAEKPGEFICPRRGGFHSDVFKLPKDDHWRDNNTCSYCGSMNPDVFMKHLEESTGLLGVTEKNYKVYVHPVDGDGMEKFYFAHLREEQMVRFVELYNQRKIGYKGGFGFTRFPFFMVSADKSKQDA